MRGNAKGGAINTLQKRNWIIHIDVGNGRRKEYIITETGKNIVSKEKKRLKTLIDIAEEIFKKHMTNIPGEMIIVWT
ncbi:hypothetical protein CLTEP_26660 [Clostridium tepidiprofundi DSM 19306]|uniref:Transcriptional regulator PadR-like family protein n=1 Tax=Clostridium tepidiprofundi DSM 19306 TaxID=1121338 RepID=A0A151AS88_9CLOT|nr:hypothetical protein [Clostridium tepidiprofundi]KYH30443.1 hypothetical protein CLTEP_26660 [Clostridium tepidiprofundi DSM 19306]